MPNEGNGHPKGAVAQRPLRYIPFLLSLSFPVLVTGLDLHFALLQRDQSRVNYCGENCMLMAWYRASGNRFQPTAGRLAGNGGSSDVSSA